MASALRKLGCTMLDVRRLRLLSELSRRGTIAAVARVAGYTPSAVSQSLQLLEREAGVALLERDGRRVRLTPAARGLVVRTDRVLAELDAAAAELAAEPQALAAYRDAPWIAGVAGTQFAAALEHACRAAGFAPRIAHRADDARLIPALVAAGLGMALLPALACAEATGVRLAEVTPLPPARHVDALAAVAPSIARR